MRATLLQLDLNFDGIKYIFPGVSAYYTQQLLSSVTTLKNPLAAPALGDIHPSAISEIGSLMKSQMLHGVRSQQPLVKTQDTVPNTLSFPPLLPLRVA